MLKEKNGMNLKNGKEIAWCGRISLCGVNHVMLKFVGKIQMTVLA